MPWKEVTQMEELIRFVTLARGGQFTITDLCEQFGISRKTGYKHLERYAATGLVRLRASADQPALGTGHRRDDGEEGHGGGRK